MARLYTSFTAVLREMAAGRLTVPELSFGFFMFGCAREHAFEPWKHTPNELTWFFKDNPEEGLRLHAELVNVLLEAESTDRVIWRDEVPDPGMRIRIANMMQAVGAEIIR